MAVTRTTSDQTTAKLLHSRGSVSPSLRDKLSNTLSLVEVFVRFAEESVDLLIEFVGVLD
jgi:hypothetical protein